MQEIHCKIKKNSKNHKKIAYILSFWFIIRDINYITNYLDFF